MADPPTIYDHIATYLPPAFGAFVGLTNAGSQTAKQRVVGFSVGFGLAVYFGPAVGEALALGPKVTVGVSILIAIMGGNIIGGLFAVASSFRADPLASFKGWWGAWWNRGGQP